jgi:hypothetical protein
MFALVRQMRAHTITSPSLNGDWILAASCSRERWTGISMERYEMIVFLIHIPRSILMLWAGPDSLIVALVRRVEQAPG